ncbi:MAG: hypothetical protein ABI316_11210 [Casimicrobiaceae bacterium]
MRNKQWMQIAAVASAISLSGAVMAADAGQVVTQMQNNPSAMRPPATAQRGMAYPQAAGGSDRTLGDPPALDAWMNDYATAHNGRITREEFMDQMNNRWDTLDAQHRGYMTPDEARNIYAPRQEVRPARTGSDVTPGYNGPGSSKSK